MLAERRRSPDGTIPATALIGLRVSSLTGASRLLAGAVAAISWLADLTIVAVLSADVVLVALGVADRDFFHHAILYVPEVSEWCLVYLAFIGGAQAYRRGSLVGMTVLVSRLSGRWATAAREAQSWMAMCVGFWMCLASPSLLIGQGNNSTDFPILGWSNMWEDLPLAAGGGLLVLYVVTAPLKSADLTLPIWTVVKVAAAVGLPIALDSVLAARLTDQGATLVALAACILGLVVGLPIALSLMLASFVYFPLSGLGPPSTVDLDMSQGVSQFLLVAVPFFVLAGVIMAEGEIGRRIVDLFAVLVGRVRGGMLHVAILSMIMVSGMSGSKAGDIAVVGSGISKGLRERGYENEECAAVLSASAAMGETIPPSIVMLVLASVSSMSVATLFAAGLIPALVLALGLMIVVAIKARYRGFPHGERRSIASCGRAAKRAIFGLGAPALLFAALLGGFTTPTEGSAIAVLYAALVSILLGLKTEQARNVMGRSIGLTGMIMLTVAGAKAFSFFLTFAGVAASIAHVLAGVGGRVPFELASVLALVILGSVFEGLPALLVFPPLLLPIAAQYGIEPIQYGILMIVATGIGAFTPPLGVGSSVAFAVMDVPMESTTKRLVPYLAALVLGALLVALIPALTLWLPARVDW